MPLLPILFFVVGILVFTVVLLPLSIFMRFRAASTKRRAFGWLVTLNLVASVISSALLLTTAAVSNFWIPNTFRFTLIGAATGFVLGFAGLAASRWERSAQGLHYTPNRWLILIITLVVTARILYGVWRAWHSWQTTPAGESWLAASGAAGSMGAGAAVLGYYVVYWSGLLRKLRAERFGGHARK